MGKDAKTDSQQNIERNNSEWFANGLRLRLATILHTDEAVLTEKTYFDGGDVLVCAKGRFQFEFDDGTDIVLNQNEILILYPGSYVTIRCTAPHSQLNYVILSGGILVADYFNSFAFYDRLRFTTDIQYGTFAEIMRLAAEPTEKSAQVALETLSYALRTFQHDLRRNGAGLLFDAVKAIHESLAKGIVRSDSVFSGLNTSRSHLHAMFVRGCGISPGEFIRREQLRVARWLLTNTNDPLKQIAARIGIDSPVYFTTFIRRMTGRTPSELRNNG